MAQSGADRQGAPARRIRAVKRSDGGLNILNAEPELGWIVKEASGAPACCALQMRPGLMRELVTHMREMAHVEGTVVNQRVARKMLEKFGGTVKVARHGGGIPGGSGAMPGGGHGRSPRKTSVSRGACRNIATMDAKRHSYLRE